MRLFIIAAVLVGLPLCALAQTVYFTNGAELDVESAWVDGDYVVIRDASGKEAIYYLDDVDLAKSALVKTRSVAEDSGTRVAESGDIDGFRQYSWGDPPGAFGLIRKLYDEDGMVGYSAPHESNSFGEAEADSIAFIFYKDEFAMVMIEFSGRMNMSYLKEALDSRYGVANQPNQFIEHYIWTTASGNAELKYSGVTDTGNINIFSRSLFEQFVADKSESAAAEGAAGF